MHNDSLEPIEPPKPKSSPEFLFSWKEVSDRSQLIYDARNTKGESIKALMDRFEQETDSRYPVLQQILGIYTKPDGLDIKNIVVLGRVLQRLGTYYKEFEDLDKQCRFIDFAASRPEFVSLMFGDLDSSLSSFFNEPDIDQQAEDATIFEDPS